MTDTIDELIERLTELQAKANLPWRVDGSIYDGMEAAVATEDMEAYRTIAHVPSYGDALAIVAAINALPDLLQALKSLRDENVELVGALLAARSVAEEARVEWDQAPSGMRAGKILIALSGVAPGYRADIDAIHATIARSLLNEDQTNVD